MATSVNNTGEFCVPKLSTRGKAVWFHSNPLDYPYPLMMAQIILISVTSQALYCCLRPLGQTKFVCNLLAGIILGPSVLGKSEKYRQILLGEELRFPLFETLAKIGMIYAVFLFTAKIDISMLRKTVRNAWKIALATSVFPVAVSLGVVYPVMHHIPGLEGGFIVFFFITTSLSFNYFPVLVQALDELDLMTSELGQLALSSAMLNDAMQWVLSVVHLVLLKRKVLIGVGTLLSILALLAFSVFVTRRLLLLIGEKTPEGKEVKQGYIVAIQLGVLVMAFLSETIGIKHITGPMILGLVMPHGSQLGATVIAKTEFVVSEFFLPLYFFQIGIKTDVYSIAGWICFAKIQALIIVIYVSKLVGVLVVGFFSKFSFKNSLVLGMMMNIKGLIELMIYNQLFSMKVIDNQLFTQLVLSTLAITMLVTPMVRFSYILRIRRESSSTSDPLFRPNIQSMTSNSELFRILCCVHNQESVPSIINLIEASNPTRGEPMTAYVVHAVEFVGRSAPLLVPYKEHKKKLKRSDTPTNQMVQAFENYSKSSGGQVIIEPYKMVAPYKSMHETISRLAQDKLVPLIIIPFHENHQSLVGSHKFGPIRQLNLNVLASSPCTVGILVDRGFPSQMSLSSFTCNVVLFFIGGPDDREALAYASRILDNPQVGMTVVRISVGTSKPESKEEEEIEFKLDESLIDEFKIRNIGNDRLIWHDIEVEDAVEVMSVISNSQGKYDLAMVGRRHADVSLRDKEMANFVQNPELGVIGDILASSDFCDGAVNVLVMQESRELGIGAFRCDSVKFSESRFLECKRIFQLVV